jgi:hypothetical protein
MGTSSFFRRDLMESFCADGGEEGTAGASAQEEFLAMASNGELPVQTAKDAERLVWHLFARLQPMTEMERDKVIDFFFSQPQGIDSTNMALRMVYYVLAMRNSTIRILIEKIGSHYDQLETGDSDVSGDE